MSTKSELQDLLRFLTKDAKLPLPTALSSIKDLQAASLTTPLLLSRTTLATLTPIFPTSPNYPKQILTAAKRVTRPSKNGSVTSPRKTSRLPNAEPQNPAGLETSLALPTPSSPISETDLSNTVLYTNRAPLVLAFAVTLLKYTMPSQPLSSRLSLGQAVVSANSRIKAVSLGLEKGASAEDEGWGSGQPTVRVMGREVRCMKRVGYEWGEEEAVSEEPSKVEDISGQVEPVMKMETGGVGADEEPALWGLDLEALRSSNSGLNSGGQKPNASKLPIHTAQSARSYLSKSFLSPPPPPSGSDATSPTKKKSTAAATNAERERNLALLLHALDLLYESWVKVLSSEELDRRAWSWYVAVRPEVKQGVAGWGGKGEVRLGDIMRLRRKG